jgi:hypothetical protein
MSNTALALPSTVGGLKAQATHYFQAYKRQHERMKNFARENEKRIEGVIGAVEVVAVAAGISYINGKNAATKGTPIMVAGYPVDMLGGIALTGLGRFEAGGKYNEHLYLAGAGMLAAYAARETYAKGMTAGVTAAQAPQAAVAGVAHAGSYAAR